MADPPSRSSKSGSESPSTDSTVDERPAGSEGKLAFCCSVPGILKWLVNEIEEAVVGRAHCREEVNVVVTAPT